MKNEIKDVLMRALETELKSEDVRTYLVDNLVDNLLKLEEKATPRCKLSSRRMRNDKRTSYKHCGRMRDDIKP